MPPFVTRVLAACRRSATLILRAAFIVVLVCFAIPFVIGWWCLYLGAAVYTVISIAVYGPPSLFRYEEESAHDHT